MLRLRRANKASNFASPAARRQGLKLLYVYIYVHLVAQELAVDFALPTRFSPQNGA